MYQARYNVYPTDYGMVHVIQYNVIIVQWADIEKTIIFNFGSIYFNLVFHEKRSIVISYQWNFVIFRKNDQWYFRWKRHFSQEQYHWLF